MNRSRLGVFPILFLLFAIGAPHLAQAADSKTFPSMAPLDQYLMERSAEIALARTAAPDSISRDAEVVVLGQKGYETAVKGKNGFVCIVQLSWTSPTDEPDFWNPKLRAPICFNAAGARFYLPIVFKKTEFILSGRSKDQMFEGIKSAHEKKELPPLEPNAMCYMLSKQGYLNSRDGHWHPHLMFYVPQSDPARWGANLSGSPIFAADEEESRITVLMVPVEHWSDGTVAQ